MNVTKEVLSKAEKETAKKWLKAQMTPPNATWEQRQEIDRYVEHAADCADYMENLAKAYGVDLRTLVNMMFGLA